MATVRLREYSDGERYVNIKDLILGLYKDLLVWQKNSNEEDNPVVGYIKELIGRIEELQTKEKPND